MSHDKPRKCVVWDLDGTVWDGVLLEGGATRLRPGVEAALRTLDGRGVLHAIASRNEPGAALARLAALGIEELFVAHEIGWGTKAESIRRIAESLRLGVASFVFVDDDPFERDAVRHELPEVTTIDARDVEALASSALFGSSPPTAEASQRRALYRAERERNVDESRFEGAPAEFLRTLDLRLALHRAGPDDLARAEELTVRTHQLNTTGVTYDARDLAQLAQSPEHDLWLARLDDRYGSYGTIGLALVSRPAARPHRIELFLLSCRVLGRGVAEPFLAFLAGRARDAGVGLEAAFRATEQNRPMRVTYRFFGFAPPAAKQGEIEILSHPMSTLPRTPDHVRIDVEAA